MARISADNWKCNADVGEGPADSAAVILEGDMLMRDAQNELTPVAAETDGHKLEGVAQGQYPLASNVDNVHPGPDNMVPYIRNGVAEFNATNGDTLGHNVPVYIGADAQTVKVTGTTPGTDIVGYIWMPNVVGTVVASATTRVKVLLQVRTPAIGLR
jgi:hypothetical protein